VREIGIRYVGLWKEDVHYPDQPFVVLREATVEDWFKARGYRPTDKTREQLAAAHFYERNHG
jgi:hypothetical protein